MSSFLGNFHNPFIKHVIATYKTNLDIYILYIKFVCYQKVFLICYTSIYFLFTKLTNHFLLVFTLDIQAIVKMKSFRKELWFETKTRRAFINITPQVEQAIDESGIKEGLALINAMHITASVFINDDESGLHHDYEVWLEKLAPEKPYSQYRHNGFEDNADAHLKRQVMGREVVVAITNGRLDFGTWERIFYGEFDGKRRKRVLVKIIGE